MARQTFVAEFIHIESNRSGNFFRFDCKLLETVLKHLHDYKEQAEGREFLYPYLTDKAHEYKCCIWQTPYECTPENLVYECVASEL